MVVALALYSGALNFVLYLAIEPLVRRRWPAVIVGWSRLIAGRWRDPLVGRELLVGCAAGAIVALTTYISMRVNARAMDVDILLNSFASFRTIAGSLLEAVQRNVQIALLLTILLVLLRALTRSTFAAGAIVTALASAASGPTGGVAGALTNAFGFVIRVITLTRFGLVAIVSLGLTFSLTEFLRGGLAEDTGTGAFVVVVIVAFIGTAAFVAMGQPRGIRKTVSSGAPGKP